MCKIGCSYFTHPTILLRILHYTPYFRNPIIHTLLFTCPYVHKPAFHIPSYTTHPTFHLLSIPCFAHPISHILFSTSYFSHLFYACLLSTSCITHPPSTFHSTLHTILSTSYFAHPIFYIQFSTPYFKHPILRIPTFHTLHHTSSFYIPSYITHPTFHTILCTSYFPHPISHILFYTSDFSHPILHILSHARLLSTSCTPSPHSQNTLHIPLYRVKHSGAGASWIHFVIYRTQKKMIDILRNTLHK